MPDRALLVLLLPCRLEDFDRRELAQRLMGSARAVAVEPGRVGPRTLARLPGAVVAGLAGMQARRMRLPGAPRAVAAFDPHEYPLARALLVAHPGCELWYGPEAGTTGLLHELAMARATLRFEDSGEGRALLAAAISAAGLAPDGARARVDAPQ